jgi:hypothetical protein
MFIIIYSNLVKNLVLRIYIISKGGTPEPFRNMLRWRTDIDCRSSPPPAGPRTEVVFWDRVHPVRVTRVGGGAVGHEKEDQHVLVR